MSTLIKVILVPSIVSSKLVSSISIRPRKFHYYCTSTITVLVITSIQAYYHRAVSLLYGTVLLVVVVYQYQYQLVLVAVAKREREREGLGGSPKFIPNSSEITGRNINSPMTGITTLFQNPIEPKTYTMINKQGK